LANHKSALKRVRQDEVRRLRNKATKTRVKNITKDVREAASSNENKESFLKNLNTAKSIIDKSAKKGVIHKRTAARKISRLSKLMPS
jgi:small subunit ribosomal protein S20